MQAVIMAGGKGTRLSSITKDKIPKPMVPVAGKPLLLWQVEELKRNGLTNLILIVGHLGQHIEDYFGDGAAYGVHISYIREQMPLGTAGAFYELKNMLDGPYFLLVFGDVCFSIDIHRMEAFHRKHQSKATLFVHPNGHPYDSDLVILNQDNKILRFDSKKNARSGWYENCVNAGFYILDADICGLVQKDTKTDLEKEILAPLAEQNAAVYGYRSSEYIKDIGTAERIWQTEADIADGSFLQGCPGQGREYVFLDGNKAVNVYKESVVSGGNMADYTKEIREYINLEREVLSRLDVCAVNDAVNLIMKAYEAEKNIYIFGNGGSAATASHYQNDFNKGISEYTGKKFRFVCLNDNIATVMAIANDIGFEEVFRFQLDNRLAEGDLIIAISGSGNSENVIRAAEYAKEQGNQVIGLCGYDGGRLKKIADVALHADVDSMQVTEDVHMVLDHLMMSVFYKALCGKEHLKKRDV